MANIADFHCDAGAMQRITPELLTGAGSSFPAAYCNGADMVKTALALKVANQACFCALPFCHTLEAEATGGQIIFDDVQTGPRFSAPVYKSLDELLQLPEIDYTVGRIAQTLEACRSLRKMGENVMLALTGPFTWLNILIGTGSLFKGLRKEPEKMEQIFARLRAELLRFTQQALDAGVNLIGYSDSVAGLNVMGPNNMERMARTFTKPLLYQMQKLVCGKAIILLCPKQSFALTGTGLARWRELPAGQNVPYVQACLAAKDGGLIFGQTCAKHYHVRVSSTVRALELLD